MTAADAVAGSPENTGRMSDKMRASQNIRSCSVITSDAFAVTPKEASLSSNDVRRFTKTSFLAGAKLSGLDFNATKLPTTSASCIAERFPFSFNGYNAKAARQTAAMSAASSGDFAFREIFSLNSVGLNAGLDSLI